MSENNPNKPKQVSWFNGCGGRIGVVVGQSGDCAYIGMALRHDEDDDVEHILAYGAKFPLEAALLLPVSKRYTQEATEHLPAHESDED
ncbi:MAG: hypothetical protein LBG66_06230 [Gallionellaceae bacterium]|jgi:hypothetical protein|nr:hypothetical protein [Gallionellaceae bacterium]